MVESNFLEEFLDRTALNQEIEAILQEADGTLPVHDKVEDRIVNLVLAARRGEVPQAGERVIEVLTLDLDDLRKAALLSLMARLTGKGKFDPVAAYVLEKRAIYVTSQG